MASKEKINLINKDYAKDSATVALERAKQLEAEYLPKAKVIHISDKLIITTTNEQRFNEYIKEYGKL